MTYKIPLIATLLLATVLVVPLATVQTANAEKTNAPKANVRASNVFADTIDTREFSSRIEALGTLEPKEEVDLTLNDAGQVQSLYFEDGQRIKKGKTLLSLAQSEQRALVEAEEAMVAEAQQQLDRVNRLIIKRAVSQSEVEEAQRDLDSAKAQLRAVQSRQRDRSLKAPFDGVLGFRQVSVGAYVQPGDVVAHLVDDSEMNVEFTVPSTVMRYLKVGTSIEALTDDYPSERFKGTIQSIDNAIDPVTRSVKVKARIPNPNQQLMSGMFMEVTLSAQPREALAVSEEAVQPVGSNNYVYVLDSHNGTYIATKTEVEIGTHQDGYIEIVSGLNEGQLIVTDGLIQVRDGGLVNIQDKAILSASASIAETSGGGSDLSVSRN